MTFLVLLRCVAQQNIINPFYSFLEMTDIFSDAIVSPDGKKNEINLFNFSSSINNKMPNPPKLISREQRQRTRLDVIELSQLLFCLRPTIQFICDGVEYQVDLDEYRERVDYARECHRDDSSDFEAGGITREEYNLRTDAYLRETVHYVLIDEDGKHCGSYDSSTKIYIIFMKRIVIDGAIYYYEAMEREVYTYCGRSIGMLSVDGREIVRHEIDYDISLANDLMD
jgi:hypothetical protein